MLPESLKNLASDFERLPGIGPKSALRMALFMLKVEKPSIDGFINHLRGIDKVKKCTNCFTYADEEICSVCSDPKRDRNQILVVEDTVDMVVLEETNYSGVYHILGNLISPLHGLGPDKVRIGELVSRVKKLLANTGDVEIIFACPTSLEGEATVSFIMNSLDDLSRQINLETDKKPNMEVKIKYTQLARGLPSNAGIDYQDTGTLRYSLDNRKEVN